MKIKFTFITLFVLISNLVFCQNFDNLSKEENNMLWHKYSHERAKYTLLSVKNQLYLDSLIMLKPQNVAYLWQQKAMPCYKAGKYELGAIYLDKAVELDPKEHLEYRAFMKCIFSKQHSSAIQDFKKAQQLFGEQYEMDHPNNFWISVCFLQLHQLDSAKIYMERCNDFEQKLKGEGKQHPLNDFYSGIIEYEKTNYTEAISYFDKVLAWYSNFSDAKFYKSICCIRINKEDEAKKLLTSALEDIKRGYSIVEDNVIYENYPYQIKQSWLEHYLKSFDESKN